MREDKTPLWYSDPTGNTAVRNVMRGGFRHIQPIPDRVLSRLLDKLECDIERYRENKKALASVLEHRQGHATEA
ncbi:hypothetical protein [Subtercola lobariae]|uniref:Uncharacterized protein n=1 Tax=Subtercola lobariae TaxID=1588641 RepID=A0A917B1A7_9MICO|nr:hypothetical protein [Subtercola lobariae]GGF11349.1 hypothetical protein GCM10011399_01470 [Subtercola lobariae]